MKLRHLLFLFALGASYWTSRPEDDTPRFTTDRKSSVELKLPEEDDSFVFAVFGDRTGGPDDGVKILAQAVEDVNLIDPDLVMTVGDLVQGYNGAAKWQRQADEFSGIMNRLSSPWYPVAGNHDIYWRGEGRPPSEHEADFERHFGPLWYAFRHKDCWFIALHTDEGNPLTGERDFNKPETQLMSKAQFAFLEDTLKRAKNARHVFVFLHHPRWQGGKYGDDWERVHKRLVQAGNVSAVFAGHIHRMVYDGIRDGIEYFTLATVGGDQAGDAPQAGFLHQYNLVTVRDDGLSVSTFPVGAALDPRLITREVSSAARRLIDEMHPKFPTLPELALDRVTDGEVVIELPNPTQRPIEVSIQLESGDARWSFAPDHNHVRVPAGKSRKLVFQVFRSAGGFDAGLRLPVAQMRVEYLAETHRVSLPARALTLPMKVDTLPEPEVPSTEVALHLDGVNDCVRVSNEALALPEGPFTVECWFNGRNFRGRRGLINKTEGSEFGIFVGDGKAEFIVHVDGAYVNAGAPAHPLETNRWYHVAGVFDGKAVRLYLDGELVGSGARSGKRTPNALPLFIGADVSSNGSPNSMFDGLIDEVRISTSARYDSNSFQPQRRAKSDEHTWLLLHMDNIIGNWTYDSSSRHRHPSVLGSPRAVAID